MSTPTDLQEAIDSLLEALKQITLDAIEDSRFMKGQLLEVMQLINNGQIILAKNELVSLQRLLAAKIESLQTLLKDEG